MDTDEERETKAESVVEAHEAMDADSDEDDVKIEDEKDEDLDQEDGDIEMKFHTTADTHLIVQQ